MRNVQSRRAEKSSKLLRAPREDRDVALGDRLLPGAGAAFARWLLAHLDAGVDREAASVQEGAGWVAVAKTKVRRDGTFLARFSVAAGVYRAKVRPPARTGLVPGFSPPLTLTLSR